MATITKIVDDEDARIVDEGVLRASLVEMLRATDEVALLPGACRSDASLTLKNMVISLDGESRDVPYRAFSSDWGHGISAIRVPTDAAERAIQSSEVRRQTLRALVECIPNDLQGDVDVGPRLESADNRDTDEWVEGFDSPNCCCGLYAAIETHEPAGGTIGMRRAHKAYFVVAKAGAGRAGQEFHARLSGFAASGRSLQEMWRSGDLSEAQMERVVGAGRRNRARILLKAAAVLGLAPDVDSVPDHACCDAGQRPVAILLSDSVTNVLENVGTSTAAADGSLWRYYAGAVAPVASQGMIACSALTEGFVLALPSGEETSALRIRNSVHGSIPFGSRRLISTIDALTQAVGAHRQSAGRAHPDDAWLRDRFGWQTPTVRRAGQLPDGSRRIIESIEPPQLWGSHSTLDIDSWGRSLGLAPVRTITLRPELVALAGTEPATLRAVVGQVLR